MTTHQNAAVERGTLLREYEEIRATTLSLCEPLEPEDMVIQTMPDVSPTKWHLAHTTWFFETLVLGRTRASYAPFDDRYHALFNSYYRRLGDPYPRARRGLLSRPTVDEIRAYRRHVDRAMTDLLEDAPDSVVEQAAPVIRVGLHHEQQHEELLLMDVKHVLAANPLRPAYHGAPRTGRSVETPIEWCRFDGGRVEVGAATAGFAYDNERPRHEVLLEPFELATRLVTADEYRAFMEDGGYERCELWLADGWDLVQREGWRAPLYWHEDDDGWRVMTLGGPRRIEPCEPLCHVSYFEADAFATWAGSRLPTEFEWEHAARGREIEGTFLEAGEYHPRPLRSPPRPDRPAQLFGDVWEWTASPYVAYPGYRPFEGALGEYNGKFMVNQFVLRGGCCVTPARHVRPTYRNFYYPHQRWMFSGVRLAR
jgi:ergothioneine biosynthesis protein EgtB